MGGDVGWDPTKLSLGVSKALCQQLTSESAILVTRSIKNLVCSPTRYQLFYGSLNSYSIKMTNPAVSKTSTLRAIPSVDQLLHTEAGMELRSSVGINRLTAIARQVTEEMRHQIQSAGLTNQSKDELLGAAVQKLQAICKRETVSAIRRVINATGVILHTNLGRAPLSDAARNALLEAAGYCTLEYDPETGSRGKRGAYAEELLTQLTGAEAALVVNNCASAALLILTVLARDGETIVSRGELVEIGGDFRVPDVMSNSGTVMVEVGSTNRTQR